MRPAAALKHIPKAPILETIVEIFHLPVTSCGYHGLRAGRRLGVEAYSVKELLKLGFTEVKWDGL